MSADDPDSIVVRTPRNFMELYEDDVLCIRDAQGGTIILDLEAEDTRLLRALLNRTSAA